MKKLTLLVVLGGAALMMTGCSGIRVVRASKAGGEIALIGDREAAMEKAREEMARVCGGPGNYEVVEEGEAVVGSVTDESGNATAGRGIFGNPTVRTNSHSETTQKTEWRVKYACKGATPPNVGAPPTTTQGQPTGQIHTVIVRF